MHLPWPQLKQSQGYRPQGLQKQGNVLKRGALQNVLQIVPGFVFRRVMLAQAMNLGQSGDSRLNLQNPAEMPHIIGYELVLYRWTGTDQRHIPYKHIPELRKLIERGARAVYAAVSHGVFSEGSMERLDRSPIQRLLVTDSIETQPVVLSKKVDLVSVAPLFVEAIRRSHDRERRAR